MGYGEGVGGCHACIKYLLFAFNFLFWLMGCGLVGVGIWALVDKNFKTMAENEGLEMIYYAAIALIVIGGVIMAVGFFGCCGAIRESQCLLVTFFICLFVLFTVLVGAGIWVLVSRDTFISHAEALLKKTASAYKADAKIVPPGMPLLVLLQTELKCCGGTGPLDYPTLADIPPSCASSSNILGKIEQGLTGCGSRLKAALEAHTVIISGVAIGVGVIMLLGMVFAMLLCCAIKDAN